MVAAPESGKLLQHLLVSRAAEVARAGDLHAAAALLEAMPPGDAPDVEQLHLLARIRAQQGHWLAAEGLWTRLLAQDPGHAPAGAALRRLRSRRDGSGRCALLVVTSILVLVVALAFALAYRNAQRADVLQATALQQSREQEQRLAALLAEARNAGEQQRLANARVASEVAAVKASMVRSDQDQRTRARRNRAQLDSLASQLEQVAAALEVPAEGAH